MSPIEKETTPPVLEANRPNAEKSTGPRLGHLLPGKRDLKNLLRGKWMIGELECQLKLQPLSDWRRERRQANSMDVASSHRRHHAGACSSSGAMDAAVARHQLSQGGASGHPAGENRGQNPPPNPLLAYSI